MNRLERYEGAMLGLAVGDALGATLEFMRPGEFTPLTDMVGGGPFGLAPGQWTDDTSMALCLAESLLACGGFQPDDQMRRYLRWLDEGYWSSTGTCFDIGVTTRQSLGRFRATGEPYAGPSNDRSAGNGSLMRLVAIPLRYAAQPELAIRLAGDSSRTTHAAQTAIDACRYFGGLVIGALLGHEKQELLAPRFSPVACLWEQQPLHPEVDAVAAGSFLEKNPPAIRGTGYVVRTLEAALWAFASTGSFEDGALAAVNLGDDSDTTGAVYGQLAGAFYGLSGIPVHWRDRVSRREDILGIAEALCEAAWSGLEGRQAAPQHAPAGGA